MDNFQCNTAISNSSDNIRNMMFGLDALVELDNNKMVPAINLDNAATTPPFKEVIQEIERQLMYYGSIGRGKGQKSENSTEVYTNGRDIVKDFVGANSDIYTVFYINNATDGINKLASAFIESPEDIVLSTRMEHHANDLPWRERTKTVYAEVDKKGRLIVDDIKRLLKAYNGRIKYVTVTAASNVTGYVNDVHYIAKLAHQYGAKIIVDGAQIVAHRAFNMLGQTLEENIDFFVFSAHKMYSPFGGGAVVGLTDVLNKHIAKFYGGGMVEAVCDYSVRYLPAPDRYEAGSPNYPGVVGMLRAMEVLKCIGFDYIKNHEQILLRRALDGLMKLPGVILYGDNENIADRVGIAVFTLRGIKNEEVANFLAGYRAIAVRHAAFCAHPYVRRLTGGSDTSGSFCYPLEGMVRISFGIYNNETDVDTFLATIKELLYSEYLRHFARVKNNSVQLSDRLCIPYDRA
ncbi:aminotransferase class V-fold PLP-dependent enzyme [Lachnoclostridium phytofermentans]|uniref:Cysteine desulfurase n=1 Tax=Lachnoclostridium phytofermentans (strain ATCC 700394 / DSM 18823 / ISDg) TaxID=357809 RepID=A9KP34_LACP7|nr:aminotransferase class V-fold PLP-dependent enzyme [Lachnoclostridium phytofermentans]ABX43204.1 Cysteine desulfurase [Lachnoclostridium phytofermentans ISDg]